MDSQLATVLAARAAVGEPQVGAEALQEAALEANSFDGPNPPSCSGGGCISCAPSCRVAIDLSL